MELQLILERYAEAIETIDANPPTPQNNRRTGSSYRPGFVSIGEIAAVHAVDATWALLHPHELVRHQCEVPYPILTKQHGRSATADHVFSTRQSLDTDADEWGIEVKRLQSVGDNGKPNDFVTTKVLSPCLKDRGMLHDALRLRQYGFTERVSVVGYGFN